MKKYALMVAGLALFVGGPMMADEMKMDKMEMKHDTKMCAKHCNIMELEKKVDALKGQVAAADKTVTKEHLKKDIETYEKKLKELEIELNEMK